MPRTSLSELNEEVIAEYEQQKLNNRQQAKQQALHIQSQLSNPSKKKKKKKSGSNDNESSTSSFSFFSSAANQTASASALTSSSSSSSSSSRRSTSSGGRCTNFLLYYFFPIFFLLIGVGLLLHNAPPAFDPAVLQEIIDRAHLHSKEYDKLHARWSVNPLTGQQEEELIGSETQVQRFNATVQFIQNELHKAYPKHITKNNIWTTNLAGGFKTGMLVLHGSLTEYVMIWGTNIPTTGHSGRNLAEFHDWIIAGEGEWWREHGLTVERHRKGDYVHTNYLHGGMIHLQRGTWMLEYCHGIIPALLPFGLADSLVSSLDPVTIIRSLVIYGRLVIKELIYNFKI